MIESALAQVAAGETPPPEQMPPARYTLDGSLEQPDDEPWPNFQVDGYGMWLWALAEHTDGRPVQRWSKTVELVARYISATWQLKSFSCWEEFDDGEHASTLGALVAGLDAAARLLQDPAWADEADRVRATLLDRFVANGRFTRGPSDERLDGSLFWLGVPFGVVPLDDPILEATVEGVRRELLRPDGGVYRYRGDTYYGGGEWILLTCSLAWHDACTGNLDAVAPLREWVRADGPSERRPARAGERPRTGARHDRALGCALGTRCDAAPLVARDVPDHGRRRARMIELLPDKATFAPGEPIEIELRGEHGRLDARSVAPRPARREVEVGRRRVSGSVPATARRRLRRRVRRRAHRGRRPRGSAQSSSLRLRLRLSPPAATSTASPTTFGGCT